MVAATPLQSTSAKHAVLSFSVGVTALLVVDRNALYSRYLSPENCGDNDTGDVLKNVAAVPSGPTKLNGPFTLFEPASWNLSAVFTGVTPFQENVCQIGVLPGAGLLSFGDEMRLPDAEKPLCM